MWTDEQLQKEYQYCGERTERELYRLARLGLAAEQVGKTQLTRMAHHAFDNVGYLRPLLDSPAWRKP